VRESTSEWFLPLDDDDTLHEDCIERLLEASEGMDIVYPWCHLEGMDMPWVANKLYSEVSLFRGPSIPVTSLISRRIFDVVGGYREEQLEDYYFYVRAAQHGARFKCLPEVLWTYNFHQAQNFQRQA
jgi:glycosyltransferase involved in cell wall biosynthesis